MDSIMVKDYLVEWIKKDLPDLIGRNLKVVQTNRIVSIYGPRRAGKTFYFYQMIKEKKDKSLYLNFEDTRLLDVKFKDLRDLIRMYIELKGNAPESLFLDEVQNLQFWEKGVREIFDTQKYNIYITGSSSKLLSREIATALRGRTFSYLLLPFSFDEYLKAKAVSTKLLSKDDEAVIRNHLVDYLEYGGFPEILFAGEKERILKEYYDLLLFRDVIERHNLKSISLAKFLLALFIQNYTKEISINKIVNFFKSQGKKFGKNTIYDYVDKITDSVTIFLIPRYSKKVYLRESWPKKIYLCDTGFARLVKFSEDRGKLMENCVFLHLLRRINDRPLLEIYYYKDPYGKEVDFVLKEREQINSLIQVCCDIEQMDVPEREVKSLISAGVELKCKDLQLITWDYEGKKKYSVGTKDKEIKFIPLWKWLLEY
ncbi:MAG: ATP-binding protein [bacterium]